MRLVKDSSINLSCYCDYFLTDCAYCAGNLRLLFLNLVRNFDFSLWSHYQLKGFIVKLININIMLLAQSLQGFFKN